MVGHQWLPQMNNPTPGSISVTPAKQEQEIPSGCLRARKTATCHHFRPVVGLSTLCLLLLVSCVALSVLYNNESEGTPDWNSLLSDYQNISDSYLTLTEANNDLRRDNEVLKKQSSWLDEQVKLLNKTSARLLSVNAALSLESSELKEQTVNLTSTNLHLSQEHDRLVGYTSEREEEKLNMTETIQHLGDSNARRQEENRRLSEMNSFLQDELLQMKDINDEFQGEVKHLSKKASKHSTQLQERVSELQEQNQNLSTMLVKERQEAAERETSRAKEVEQIEADLHSVNEAYRSLALYCPVVNQKIEERICRKCSNSWRLFQNKCYYFSSRMLTWSSSRAWCQTQGADLLVINSEPEQSFIFESSRALQEQRSTRLWIGLTDAEAEGEWRWVDGSKVTSDVQFWLSRPGKGTEPDNWKLDDPLGEDCGHIDMSENVLRSWMDGSCKIPYRWICEKNI